MAGPVLVLIALFIVGPIALFITGAIWSALQAWLMSDDADARANLRQLSVSETDN